MREECPRGMDAGHSENDQEFRGAGCRADPPSSSKQGCFWGREGGVCRRDQAPGEGSAGMRGAFGRRGVRASVRHGRLKGD